jgi:hypothetical protein
MYDRTLVLDILGQIDGALQKVRDRSPAASPVPTS